MTPFGILSEFPARGEERVQIGVQRRGPAVGPISELSGSAFPLRVIEVDGAFLALLSGYRVTAKGV
jgi:hypothetical protein